MKVNYEIKSTDGINTLSARKWIPDGETKAVLQVTHGMIEFMDRYEGFAEYMSSKGFAVYGYDQLGHGDSVETKADWGYIGQNPDSLLILDMQKQRELAQEENPGLPYFMLGHSMGSYELRRYISEFGEGLGGAIIMGTGFEAPATTALGKSIVKTLIKLKGERHISRAIEAMAFGNVWKKWDVTGKNTANSWLTKDEALVEQYYNEPRTTFKFTLNAYLGLFNMVNFDCKQSNVNKVPKELPCLFVSGADDPIGAEGEGVNKTFDMFAKAKVRDITIRLFEGDRHEILNETDKNLVYEYLLGWLEDRCY